VTPKVVKVDGKRKLVNEVKPSEIVDVIFSAWKKVVESPTQESYASNVMQFPYACKKKIQSFLTMFKVPFWTLLRKK